MKQEIGIELQGDLLIEKSPKLFPVAPWTRVGDRRHLFEAWFPLSDLADPPTGGRRARPLHVVFGTLMDMEVTDDIFMRMIEKFADEGLCEGVWLRTKAKPE